MAGKSRFQLRRDAPPQFTGTGRPGEPAEIAAAGLYFASDDSAYTTGTELRIDGGALAI